MQNSLKGRGSEEKMGKPRGGRGKGGNLLQCFVSLQGLAVPGYVPISGHVVAEREGKRKLSTY